MKSTSNCSRICGVESAQSVICSMKQLREQAERALSQSELRLHRFCRILPEPIFVKRRTPDSI